MPEIPDRLPLFAVTAPGLEALCAAELRTLGVRPVPGAGGVAWEGALRELCEANLRLRTASRILVRVAEFRARTFFELERHARKVPWARFLAGGRAVRLRVTCRKSRLYHEGAVAERFHTAIERSTGSPPAGADADPEEGGEDAQLFVIRFMRDVCTVSADASGALLHRRGYRQALARAPLRETLAAALIQASGWDPATPLVDPMCGSGTIPIEAALIARRIAPGLASPGHEPRRYAFQEWPGFDTALWDDVVARARGEILPEPRAAIRGSDRDAGAVAAARANAERAGVGADVAFEVRPLSAAEPPPGGPGTLVTNPPYGVRVGETAPLHDLYAALGRLARSAFPGWTLALVSADRALEAQIGIRLEERVRTNNGGIAVRFAVGSSD